MSWVAEVDPVTSSFIAGRFRREAGSRAGLAAVELWIDAAFEQALTLDRAAPEPLEFRLPLPIFCFDGQEHSLEVRCADSHIEQKFQSVYDGFIDPFSEHLLGGWARDFARMGSPVAIDIDLNGRNIARVLADVFRDDFQAHCGFRYQLPPGPELSRSFVLRARIAGTDIDLQRSPVLSLARPRVVRAAQQFNLAFHYLEQRVLWDAAGHGAELNLTPEERLRFADLLLAGTSVADVLELRRRFLQPMQTQLTEDYARRDYATLGTDYPQSVPRRARGAHLDRPVDIVVPVYAGLRETERCLDSILNSPAGCRYQLICVLDNPEALDLNASVRAKAKQDSRLVLIENPVSVGFAESVNRALRLHRDRDAAVVHADCEVHGDWLLRLQHAAYEGTGAGMVNPLTNQAEFLRYTEAGPELPPGTSLAALDTVARRANSGTVPLPTALSFCLFIRRGCIDDLGFLHNDEPSGGYFAEKYFSVNAAALGWRSILATNVFVQHREFASFSQRDPAALEAARNAFERWCPFFRDSVTDFLVDRPALPAYRELDLGRLEAVSRPTVCLVTHGAGGGTERHLQDLAAALALDGWNAVILYSLPQNRVQLATAALYGIDNLEYSFTRDFGLLVHDLNRLSVRHLHFHSHVDVPEILFSLPEKLGVRYDVTVHDYAWFCPRITLVNHSGVYCGEPPAAVCTTCSGLNVPQLREVSQGFLANARRVFCPSHDTRSRMADHFQLENLHVRPNPEWLGAPEWEMSETAENTRTRVATLGRLSGHKGLRVLSQCAAHALEWNLPLDFLVIGTTSDDEQLRGLTNVQILGAYQEHEAEELVERYAVRVALLPSVWPETYSYTLSIALRCGLVPVAFDLGAIAERLRRAGTGVLLPLGADAAEINRALLEAGRQRKRTPPPPSTGYLSTLRDYYGLSDLKT